MSLTGCIAISADFLAFTGILQSSKDVSVSFSNLCVWKRSHYPSTPPHSPKQSRTKRAQVFRQSSPSVQIQKSFKRTIQAQVSLHQTICPSGWDLLASVGNTGIHCSCSIGLYCKLLKQNKTKTNKQNLTLNCTHACGNCSWFFFFFLVAAKEQKHLYSCGFC